MAHATEQDSRKHSNPSATQSQINIKKLHDATVHAARQRSVKELMDTLEVVDSVLAVLYRVTSSTQIKVEKVVLMYKFGLLHSSKQKSIMRELHTHTSYMTPKLTWISLWDFDGEGKGDVHSAISKHRYFWRCCRRNDETTWQGVV
jgi:hypothetical protein